MNGKLKMLFHYDPYEMHLNILICQERWNYHPCCSTCTVGDGRKRATYLN